MSGDVKCNYDRTLYDVDTGEVVEIRAGSKIVPPERVKQQEHYVLTANKTSKEKTEDYLETSKLRGNFFSILCKETELLWEDISEPTMGKLIYLATYINRDNCICKSGGWESEDDDYVRYAIPMSKSDIQSVLKVSYPTFRAFWNECESKQLIIENGGKYFLRREMFRFCNKDGINLKKIRMIKMFKHAIRYMYENTDERSKKTLMYLYRLIPFINLTYNTLCLNPFESCKENIQALPLSKICEIFGVDSSNQTRLLKKLKNLRFVDKQGNVCSVIRYSWMYCNEDKYWVAINPQFYSGYISEENMVEMIKDFRFDEFEITMTDEKD